MRTPQSPPNSTDATCASTPTGQSVGSQDATMRNSACSSRRMRDGSLASRSTSSDYDEVPNQPRVRVGAGRGGGGAARAAGGGAGGGGRGAGGARGRAAGRPGAGAGRQ